MFFFQGREKDVAIFSCVRASKEGGIGFVEDFRRMNVGITRAKASILVCLNFKVLNEVQIPCFISRMFLLVGVRYAIQNCFFLRWLDLRQH